MVQLPFGTPVANVLRFLIIEYLIIKLLHFCIEGLSSLIAKNRLRRGENVQIADGLITFFHVPYRLRERKLFHFLFPWVVVILLNAFLISIEFGFSSTQETMRLPVTATSSQEMPLATLPASRSMQDVSPRRWIDRLERLHTTCVQRQEKHRLRIYAPAGFMTDEFVRNDSALFFNADPTCADDTEFSPKLPALLFDVSYSGLDDVEEPFSFASAALTVNEILDVNLGFRNADVDLQVSGELDLSQGGFNKGDFVKSVSGVCTGDSNADLLDPNDSPHVYCYLTDGQDYRFIVPGVVQDDTSQFETLGQIEAGDSLQVSGQNGVFRAKFLPYLDDDRGEAMDGDHLAAIKTFAVSFGTRGRVTDETMSLALSPAIRTFCGATLYGITQLERRDIVRKVRDQPVRGPERAVVSSWALVMLCVLVALTGGGAAALSLVQRRTRTEGVPVTYNSLAAKMMERLDIKDATGLICTALDDGSGVRRVAFVEDMAAGKGGSSDGMGGDEVA